MKKSLSLGEKIKLARQQVGLSQKELGQRLQLSDKAISTYEVGRAQPSLEILQDISVVTQRPVGYFLNDGPEMEKIDFKVKIDKIEQELAAVKAALKEKGYL